MSSEVQAARKRIRPLLGIITLVVAAASLDAQATTSTTTLAQLVLDLLPTLGSSTTLGAWRQANPADSITLAGASYHASFGAWCARADRQVRADSRPAAHRTVYFYLPPAPATRVLPTGASSARLIDECTAGAAWIVSDDASPERNDTLRRDTDLALSAAVGRPDTAKRLSWYGSAFWRGATFRTTGGVAIVSATERDFSDDPGRRAPDSLHTFVLATTVRSGESPIAGEFRRGDRDDDQATTRRARARVEESFRIAAIPGPVEAALRSFLAIFEPTDSTERRLTLSERTAFATAMDRWVRESTRLPPPRRAAALFAADAVLDASEYSAGWADSDAVTLRRRLEATGAAFNWSPLGAAFVYTRTWLRQALRVAPGTRAGELAFLSLAELGFETTGMCGDHGSEGFRVVVARGSEYLRLHPRSPIRGAIHLLMAQAYGDIVSLAEGGGYDATPGDSESLKYQPEETSARTHAIAEYRIALPALADPSLARSAWLEGWRLIAGLPPSRTYFYCIYD